MRRRLKGARCCGRVAGLDDDEDDCGGDGDLLLLPDITVLTAA